jgi:hypothetical protein
VVWLSAAAPLFLHFGGSAWPACKESGEDNVREAAAVVVVVC